MDDRGRQNRFRVYHVSGTATRQPDTPHESCLIPHPHPRIDDAEAPTRRPVPAVGTPMDFDGGAAVDSPSARNASWKISGACPVTASPGNARIAGATTVWATSSTDFDMTSPDISTAVADVVARWLTARRILDTDTADMLESTWGCRHGTDLARLLADPEDTDAQTALELLFFPSEDLCASIERLLGGDVIDEPAQAVLVRRLTDQVDAVPIALNDTDITVTVRPPAWVLAALVRRLRLAHSPTPTVQAAAADIAEPHRLAILVRIRHSRISSVHADFLAALLAGLNPDADPIAAVVDEAVLLLETMTLDEDRFDALTARKRRLFRAAQAAEDFERRLTRQNIETLMLQGHPIPTMSPTEARERMRRIDRICRAVFGKVPVIEPPDFVSETGMYDGMPPLGDSGK